MKYLYRSAFCRPANAQLVKVERNVRNPLPGLSFVSIAYWNIGGEIVGVIL